MRFSAGTAANLLAWAVLAGLALAALFMVNRLGFAGLLLLGLATWLVSTLAALDQDSPTYGAAVFRARMQRGGTPEQRAAEEEERSQAVSPLRFYGRCGIVLALIGAAGFAWQALQ